MSRLYGVDVSGWNEGIDTRSLTADFVIVKATEGIQGTCYNPSYRRMADDAAASGKLIGFYHYANGGDPIAEADSFCDSIIDYFGRAIACLDWEGKGNRAFLSGQDVQWCLRFLDRVAERTGGIPLLYTNKGTVNRYDWSPVAVKYPLWGAEYAHERTHQGYPDDPWQSSLPWGAWGTNVAIHQFGYVNPRPSNGGISQLDGDVLYGDANDWNAWCKSGGASVPKTMVNLGDVAATIHYDMCVDEANGYSQAPVRWGGDSPHGAKTVRVGGRDYTYKRGSYDCSSSVITAWRLALQGTPYEGALDAATYTGDMKDVFVGSGLFTASYTPAKRGDVYLAEGKHTAMCQDGGSDGVLGYDALSEFNRNEMHGATNGKVGDQDGGESVIRGYYDDGWNTVLHYNGKADHVAEAQEDATTHYERGDSMVCLMTLDGDPTVHYYDGTDLHALANPDEKAAIQMVYEKVHGRAIPEISIGSREAPFGARFNDAISRGPAFRTMTTFGGR